MGPVQGEPFAFLEPVEVQGAVEIWMGAVEAMMKKSLHQYAKEAVAAYPDAARGTWLQKTLGMLGLAGATIWWTWETEDALQKMTAGSHSAMKVTFLVLTLWIRSPLAAIYGASWP